jgi:hypothetical protein
MGSDAPRSVGSVRTTNRTVVPITVMVRICLANAHGPIGADASGSVDSIGTSGCVARLREHERSKCNDDGEHRYAISGEAQHSVFHFNTFSVYRSWRLFHRRSTIKNPGHTTGVSALQHFAMQGNASSPLGDKSMRAQYAETLRSCNKYPPINYQLRMRCSPARSNPPSRTCATLSLTEGEARWA